MPSDFYFVINNLHGLSDFGLSGLIICIDTIHFDDYGKLDFIYEWCILPTDLLSNNQHSKLVELIQTNKIQLDDAVDNAIAQLIRVS